MKKYFALFLITIPAVGFTQNKLFIPILPNECTTCISHLAQLTDLDKRLSKTLVFPKRYKADSAILSKRMYLEDYKANIDWSDSIFNKFKNEGAIQSSVVVFNEESGKSINVNIASIEQSIPFFNSLNQTDTFNLMRRAFGGETILRNSGRYLYCFDLTAKEIRAFDKIGGQLLYTLSTTDSMVKAAFRLRYPANKWNWEYQEAKEFTAERKRLDPNAFEAMYCSNDTVYAISHFAYMIRDTTRKEKEATNFLALSVYKDGRMIDFSIVENYIDPSFKGINRGLHRITETGDLIKEEDAYYIMGGEFFVHNGILYSELLGYYAKGIPNHILGIFKKNEKNTYEHKGFYKGTLPSEYVGMGYDGLFPGSGILFSYPYIALMSSNHFFSISPDRPDLELPVLPPMNNDTKGIFGIKVSQDNAYVMYKNGKDKWLRYAKMDIHANKIIEDIPFWDTSLPFIAECSIDDFDYRYIYIPISERTIVRKKVID